MGFEDNPAVNLTLPEKRKALNAYRTRWEMLRPNEKWQRTVQSLESGCQAEALSFYAFTSDSTSFVESVSREYGGESGRSRCLAMDSEFAINPRTDVITVVVVEEDAGYVSHTGWTFFMPTYESQHVRVTHLERDRRSAPPWGQKPGYLLSLRVRL